MLPADGRDDVRRVERIRLAALLVLVACSSSAPPRAGGPGDFMVRERAANCDYLTRCGLFRNAQTCLEGSENGGPVPAPVELFFDVQAAFEAGKLDWDDARATACIDSFAAHACEATGWPACEGLTSGNVDAGGACAFGAECRSSICTARACGPGACAAVTIVPIDGDCGPGRDCVAGASCVEPAPGHGGFRCWVDIPAGDPCEPGIGPQCADGLVCLSAPPPGPGDVCGLLDPPAAHGAACTSHCQEIGDVCTGTCTAYALEGEACGTGAPCSPYLVCTAAQICAPSPSSHSLGAACVADDPSCLSGFCTDGTCTEAPSCI